MNNLSTDEEKQNYRTTFIERYLSNFKEPVKNTKEYADNIIRYVRLTKYIYIRGGGYYIDLEPRRMIEIESLLEMDNGSAKKFSLEEYKAFIGDYYSYTLPFETIEKLTKIAEEIVAEINALEYSLSLSISILEIANNI